MKRLLLITIAAPLLAQSPDLVEGKAQFETRCGGCHGGDGKGGPRAPDIVTPGLVPERTDAEVREVIRDGLPDMGMPGFVVPEPALSNLVAHYLSLTAPARRSPVSGDIAAGEQAFAAKGCVNCHTRQNGSARGPSLSRLGERRTLAEIEESIADPSASIGSGYQVVELTLQDGKTLKGFARNRSNFDLQFQAFNGRLEFFERSEIAKISESNVSLMPRVDLTDSEQEDLVAYLSRLEESPGQDRPLAGSVPWSRVLEPKKGEWPSYNGLMNGNRHSSLTEISPENISSLRPAWSFPITEAGRDLEMTPVVVDGVMYVTTANKVHALDASSGREIWTYQRPRTPGVMGDAGRGANRGVAVLGDRVFMVTDNANMLAIDRLEGRLLWESEMGDHLDHYGGTLAPLVVKDVVIGGVGGGDEGIRGFVVAYDVNTGEERWRFWTIPLPGEPGSETWKGNILPHGCGATWLTGTYDPDLDLLYWPVGNPCPDMNGDNRVGDNLYSDSMLALDPDTGELKWHYQFTPHDEFDWDAQETPILVDADWQGSPRKLLLQANRNGFFYVIDRTNGELLRGVPFIDKLTWATGIGDDGRPILVPGKRPTFAGNVVCPGLAGGTNWLSPAYSPDTGLFYVQATEYCQVFSKREEKWERGKAYFGGAAKNVPGEVRKRFLRAIDVATGERRWEIYEGDGGWRSWGGVLSTASGLVFYGDDSGAFAAVRATDGEPLWSFNANVAWHASPMTYEAKGRQYVSIAAGRVVMSFALSD